MKKIIPIVLILSVFATVLVSCKNPETATKTEETAKTSQTEEMPNLHENETPIIFADPRDELKENSSSENDKEKEKEKGSEKETKDTETEIVPPSSPEENQGEVRKNSEGLVETTPIPRK